MPKTASRGHRPTVSLSSAFGWHVWSISVQSHVEGAERRQLARRRVFGERCAETDRPRRHDGWTVAWSVRGELVRAVHPLRGEELGGGGASTLW